MNLDTRVLKNGDLILNKYKIIEILGEGNFSFVYLVKGNSESKKHFVLKEFFPHELVERGERNEILLKKSLTPWKIHEYTLLKEMFQKEANNLKIITHCNHPGLMNIISYHENVNNTSYILTDYVETIPLKNHLKNLTPRLLVKLCKELLLTLEHIHHYNIYHQDIKLDNILIKKDLTPLIIDFGASTLIYDKKSGKYLNTTSPHSAALEQLSLNYPPEIDKSTDVYSVAALIYKILTSNYPINAKIREQLIEQGKSDPYIPLISRNLFCFDKNFLIAIDKALSLYPEERYFDAKEFRLALNKNKPWYKIKHPFHV
jgi:serine/threonine protein kinase